MPFLETFYMNTTDDKRVFVRKWQKSEVKFCVQMLHGMSEHSGRYNDLASFFIEKGAAVYCSDHRGHGLTTELSSGVQGFFSSHLGWQKVLDDIYLLNQKIRNENPEVPLVMLGHSMGSFLSMNYLIKYEKTINALILTGSTFQWALYSKFLNLIVKLIIILKGEKETSKLIKILSFDLYNKQISKNSSEFSWLSSDVESVEKYAQDKYCGFFCKNKLWSDLLSALSIIFDKTSYNSNTKNIPILILGGAMDPVSSFGKGITRLDFFLKDVGFENVQSKIYQEKRHEILNELGKDKIFEDILSWITSIV